MKRLRSAVIGLFLLALLPSLGISHAQAPAVLSLSGRDRLTAQHASVIAGHNPVRALRWLRRQRSVARVAVGRDRRTLDIHFRDGAEAAIVPRAISFKRAPIGFPSYLRPLKVRQATAATGKAAVLEPFATELGLGASAGQSETDSLTRAGFSVSILRDNQVTINGLPELASDSVVYMETHSGSLDNGDAVVLTPETDVNAHKALFQEHSIIQAFAAGDPKLYLGFTGIFVLNHMDSFPNSSILFLNGCSLLGAPTFWSDLHQKNVSTMVSWDHKSNSQVDEPAAQFLLADMSYGDSVSAAVAATAKAGLGSSVEENVVAHLGYFGDGDNTLAKARVGFTPPPAATATPPAGGKGSSPTKKKCKKGQKAKHGKCVCKKKGYVVKHGKCVKRKKKK